MRIVNERVRELTRQAIELAGFHCECDDRGCSETVTLTGAEFDAVSAYRGAFVVSPEHAAASGAATLSRDGRFAVVRRATA
jgi:hypothetical protein